MSIVTSTSLEYKITGLNVDAANLTIKLKIARGITESGGFTSIDVFDLDIDNADTVTLIGSAPTGSTLYASLKTALYQYLIDKSLVTGTLV